MPVFEIHILYIVSHIIKKPSVLAAFTQGNYALLSHIT